MAEFELTRLGFEMQPEAGNAMEVEGVLNPASARGPDGHLYLFPRMVSAGNFSRIGIARVRFDEAGDPVGVERLGVVLEPEADYERHGCEDPRITYIAEQRHYVMAYTAFSGDGARIAIAASKDLLTWRRLGLAQFKPYRGIAFEGINNKDASFFPHPIPDPHGRLTTALIHRPLFPGTRPEEMRHQPSCRAVNVHRESIWISYCRIVSDGNGERHCVFEHHRRLASPVEPWEQLKIGGGTPPIEIKHGWLVLYHGVHKIEEPGSEFGKLCYSAGLMVLSKAQPHIILYRAPHPILTPTSPSERRGVVNNVVFPTAIDRRDDLGDPNRLDVYYGMADNRIGAARLTVPDELDVRPVADPPRHSESGLHAEREVD